MGESAPSTGLKANAERRFPRTIAVDGSAASGKSSVGREVARRLGYPFLDTGVMYRAATVAALERGVDPDDAEGLGRLACSIRIDVSLQRPGTDGASRVWLDGRDVTEELRRPDVEEMVSLVSRVPAVREALVALQRKIASEQPLVMAGRDIGTVVLPDADLKVYLDASLAERARRRRQEFARLGREVSAETVLDDIRRRDRLDSTRDVSPLRAADDAVVINTDGMTLEQVVDAVMELVEGWK
jgi:cytidylate kinase